MFDRIVSNRIEYTKFDIMTWLGMCLLAALAAYCLVGTFAAARAAADTVFMADLFAVLFGVQRSYTGKVALAFAWAHVWARTTLGGRLLTLAFCIAWGAFVTPAEYLGLVLVLGILAWSLIFLTYDVRSRRARPA